MALIRFSRSPLPQAAVWLTVLLCCAQSSQAKTLAAFLRQFVLGQPDDPPPPPGEPRLCLLYNDTLPEYTRREYSLNDGMLQRLNVRSARTWKTEVALRFKNRCRPLHTSGQPVHLYLLSEVFHLLYEQRVRALQHCYNVNCGSFVDLLCTLMSMPSSSVQFVYSHTCIKRRSILISH